MKRPKSPDSPQTSFKRDYSSPLVNPVSYGGGLRAGLRQGVGWGKERRSFHFLERKAPVLPTAGPGTRLAASAGENGWGRKSPDWVSGDQGSSLALPSTPDYPGAAPLSPLGLSLLSDR